jgi:predicted transposase YdaD
VKKARRQEGKEEGKEEGKDERKHENSHNLPPIIDASAGLRLYFTAMLQGAIKTNARKRVKRLRRPLV